MEKTQIQHLAELSKLEFTDTELEKFIPEFEKIIKFVSLIKSADIESKSIYDEVLSLEQLRSDIPHQSFSVKEVLQNAPKKKDRYFVVPQVVE